MPAALSSLPYSKARRRVRMPRPPPPFSELALRLLRHEAAASAEPQSLAAGVDRVCMKLSDELERLVGPGGAAALVRRARTLATRDFPSLAGGRADPDPGQDEAANAAVLAHLVGLLVNLMGEELGLRPVQKIWPGVASGEDAPRSTETEG